MAQVGVRDVCAMAGGLDAWTDAGYAVERS